MIRTYRTGTSLSTLGLLTVLLAVPVGLTWRQVRQERLNRDLLAAVECNHTHTVVALLAQGADANARSSLANSRPFWYMLLDRVRGRHLPTQIVTTPILAATAFRAESSDPWIMTANAQIIQALLHAGANPNMQDAEGFSPLFNAVISDNRDSLEAVQSLLARGADIHVRSGQGTNILHACHPGAIFTYLLDHGADVNARDREGFTPLMYATDWGSVKAVKQLLQRGAKVNAQTTDGFAALMRAAENGNLAVTKLLLAAGANPRLKTKEGATAWSYAQEWGEEKYPKQAKEIERLLQTIRTKQ